MILELIESELDYCLDLKIVESNYIKPMKKHLDSNNLSRIFLNWIKILKVHTVLASKLNQYIQKVFDHEEQHLDQLDSTSSSTSLGRRCRLEFVVPVVTNHDKLDTNNIIKNIFAIYIQHLSCISDLYVQFCSNQKQSSKYFESKILSDTRFKQVLNECFRYTSKSGTNTPLANSPTFTSITMNPERRISGTYDGMPLSSFFIKPMQRITRYKLMFCKIAEYLEVEVGEINEKNAPDTKKSFSSQYADILSLYDKPIGSQVSRNSTNIYVELLNDSRKLSQLSSSICDIVNEVCRQKEDAEINKLRLKWAQTHIKMHPIALSRSSSTYSKLSDLNPPIATSTPINIDNQNMFDSLLSSGSSSVVALNNYVHGSRFQTNQAQYLERIELESSTKYCNQRILIKAGNLIKNSSNRELTCFLFNDFLLLTQAKGATAARVEDVFTSKKAQQSYYKAYRSPIMLSDIILDEELPLDSNQQQYQQSVSSMNSINKIPISSDDTGWDASKLSLSGGHLKETHLLCFKFGQLSDGKVWTLRALSTKEKIAWMESLKEACTKVRLAKADYLNRLAYQPPQDLNQSKQVFGRLLLTVNELDIDTRSLLNAENWFRTLASQSNYSTKEEQFRRRSLSHLDFVEDNEKNIFNLRLVFQIKRVCFDTIQQTTSIVPIGDAYKTRRLKIAIDDTNSCSNERERFTFNNPETTQFVIETPDNSGNSFDFLNIDLLNDSPFRPTFKIALCKILLHNKAIFNVSNRSVGDLLNFDDSVIDTIRSNSKLIQPLEYEFTLKFKPSILLSNEDLHIKTTNDQLNQFNEEYSKYIDSSREKQSDVPFNQYLKLKLHLQEFV